MRERRVYQTARCKSCGRPIVWVRSRATGKSMPVDAETATVNDREFIPDRHRSHFATCPNAKDHRNERPAKPERSLPINRRPLFGIVDD